MDFSLNSLSGKVETFKPDNCFDSPVLLVCLILTSLLYVVITVYIPAFLAHQTVTGYIQNKHF